MSSNDDGYIKGIDRTQMLLLPKTADEYIDAENPVRFVDAFVDSLDISSLGFTHSKPNDIGRHPYNPRDLLKLYIHGYLKHMRSSRVLDEACKINLETIWLLKALTPDFKTIADFRKDNANCIKKVFREFALICRQLDLFGAELVGIDGAKIKAVNSKERNFDEEKLVEKLKHIDEKVSGYMKQLEENDAKEKEEEVTRQKIKQKISDLDERKKKYEEILTKLKQSGEDQISLTDPESRLMKNNQKFEVCYNTEISVDTKFHLVPDYYVTNDETDRNQLSKASSSAKNALEVEELDVTADKGFFDSLELKECIENGITPYVPEKKGSRTAPKNKNVPEPPFYEDKFVYNKDSDTYACPAGETLVFSSWVRNKNHSGMIYKLYRTGACKLCPFSSRCTGNKLGRFVYRWEHEEILEEMREILATEEGQEIVRKRMELTEHIFGTVKRAFNMPFFLLKGLKKVNCEMGFILLAYNMRRTINILGTQLLLRFFG
jgi:transposase